MFPAIKKDFNYNMRKKTRILLLLLIVFLGLLSLDVIRYTQVEISVVRITPEEVPAIHTQPVELVVMAKYKNGKPVTNHTLFALTLGGGSWKSFYAKTDNEGRAVFIYYPYDLPSYQKPRDVIVKIRDESNSIFVEIYPTLTYSIHLVRPDNLQDGAGTVDDYLD